jgi:hypothetical protein
LPWWRLNDELVVTVRASYGLHNESPGGRRRYYTHSASGSSLLGRGASLRGRFLVFLTGEPEKVPGRNKNPEAEALRANYLALRLKTFWWSFGMSAAGFVIAVVSLIVALCTGDFLHRWR